MIPGDRNNHKWPWHNASLRRRPCFNFLWSLVFLQKHHQKVMCKMKCEAQCASGNSKFLCTATGSHQQWATISFPSSHQHHVVFSFLVLMSRGNRRWLNFFFFFFSIRSCCDVLQNSKCNSSYCTGVLLTGDTVKRNRNMHSGQILPPLLLQVSICYQMLVSMSMEIFIVFL